MRRRGALRDAARWRREGEFTGSWNEISRRRRCGDGFERLAELELARVADPEFLDVGALATAPDFVRAVVRVPVARDDVRAVPEREPERVGAARRTLGALRRTGREGGVRRLTAPPPRRL